MDYDYLDWIGYKIWIGNGKEYGFDDEEEEEETETLETEILDRIDEILQPIRDIDWSEE